MILALLLIAVPQTLPQIEQRLKEERAAAQKLAGRESSLLGRLAELERQIEVEGKSVRAAQARLKAATQRSDAAEARVRSAQGQLDTATAALGPRLTARYRMGREGYLRFLLGARSIADVLRRRRLFNALLEHDLDAISSLKFQFAGAQAARDELLAARLELQAAAQAESDKRRELQDRVDQQRTVLASVQEERAVHEQAVRELEEAEKALTEKLAEIEKGAPVIAQPPASIRKARGKLGFPLDRGRIEAHFGRNVDTRFGTVTLQHGIDVRAPQGTPVHAVFEGHVVHAGWFRGFGNLLIIDHGEGLFSLMAHLDTLEKAVGDAVAKGDEVGTVGDTGSLKGAYLYFELRDGQKPLDPERWLLRMKRAPQVAKGAAP